jgi:RecG-like helicase
MTFAVPARERPKPRSAPDLDRLAALVEVRTTTIAGALAKRGIHTAGDLLETPPRTWRDYSEGVTSLNDVVVGAEATVRVELVSVRVRPTRRRNLRIVEAAVRDDSGAATAIWFNQGFLARTLLPGQVLQLRATVRAGRGLELAVREHEVLAETGEGLHTSGVVAVYDASRTLSTRVLRELVEQHLPRTDAIADPLPVGVRIGRRLPLRRDAIAALHAPRSPEDAKIASDRLAYEELLLLQIALAARAALPRTRSAGRASCSAATTPRSRSRSPRARSGACATSTAISRAEAARCAACSSGTSARARPWSRCTRCCVLQNAAARLRCSRPRRCWCSSTPPQ